MLMSAYDGVIAALALQWYAVARGRRQCPGARPRTDHGSVADDLASLGQHGLEPPLFHPEAGGTAIDTGGAARQCIGLQGLQVGSGILAMTGLIDLHRETEGRVEVRLTLTQGVAFQFLPADAQFAAHPPTKSIVVEMPARPIDVQHAGGIDQVRHASPPRHIQMQAAGIGHQRAQRTRGAADTIAAGAGQIAQQPGRQARQIAPADRERSQRVHQITRHLLPHARFHRRYHRMRRQPAGIAIAGRFLAGDRIEVQQGDLQALVQCVDGAHEADGAAADDHGVTGKDDFGRSGHGSLCDAKQHDTRSRTGV